MLPRLHVVTDDAVLAAADFPDCAAKLLTTLGPALALHLRGHATSAETMWRHAERLAAAARSAGAALLLNDRVDLALACSAAGVQLGARSIPAPAARRLLGPKRWIGVSVHDQAAACAAAAEGADFILAGAVYQTTSHPGQPPAGLELLRACADAGPPIIAIGGVTAARVAELRAAGAHGVAVLSGVWSAADPLAAAAEFAAALR